MINRRTLEEDSVEKLRVSKRKKSYILNSCNYNILENNYYADGMFYYFIEKREEKGQFKLSEQVSKFLMIGEEKFKQKSASKSENGEDSDD